MTSGNIDILTFLHSKDSELYKIICNGYTTFLYACDPICENNLEILKWLHSVDNTLYLSYTQTSRSAFETVCKYGDIDLVKYFYSIDKDIFIKTPNKDKLIMCIMQTNSISTRTSDRLIEVLKIINENNH